MQMVVNSFELNNINLFTYVSVSTKGQKLFKWSNKNQKCTHKQKGDENSWW